jgi:transposase
MALTPPADLGRLADWLQHCGTATVAMESTGGFWIPLYEILEQHGLNPCVVNARHMKNVPCRGLTGMNARGFNSYTRWAVASRFPS